MPSEKRTPEQTWKAIEAMRREAEIDRHLAKTPAEVDASLRAAGHDPAAVRAEGAAFVAKLKADRERLAWQAEAAVGLARAQARFEARGSRHMNLSHEELRARIAAVSRDPRFAGPAAVMFRNRKPEEASIDELRALLEELEHLAETGG